MAKQRKITAPGAEHELKHTIKPAKKWYEELGDFLSGRNACVSALGACALVPLVLPSLFDFGRIIFFSLALFYLVVNGHIKLPLRVPKFAKTKDYNDFKPGRKSYNDASGLLFLGNDIEDYELWLKDTDMKTHMLIYGTTGSGKTVTLQSIAYNAFVLCTGLCYIDPKGDPNLAHEMFIMARRLNREDDFLAMDFMTGGKKTEIQTPFRMSNTTNPFAKAPADAITNLLTSLLPKDDGGGNSVFQQKATALLTALIPVLVALRDAKQALPLTDMTEHMGKAQGSMGSGMSIATIRDYLDPVACVGLVYKLKGKGKGGPSRPTPGSQAGKGFEKAKDEKTESNGEGIDPSMEECEAVKMFVDPEPLDVLKAALSSLNYVDGRDEPKKQQAYLDQFGYAKGYFGAPLSSISGMYGHLFNVSRGEIDMGDVLFNRRIMIGILPSLEKSPTECENLGKIILASVKNSVSEALGDKLEGATKEIMAARPSASKVPGIIVVDEYAAIMMPGFEVILTQARSLGFMAIIASQDYSGMKGKDQKSCDQIIENTAVKIFMKMASAGETWDLIKKLFGQFTVEEINLTKPDERGTIKQVDKVSQFDLMDQREGEFHAFYGGKLIIGTTQYMVPKALPHHFMRINRFIRTDTAPDAVKANLEKENDELSRDMEAEDRAWLKNVREKCRISEICFLEMETGMAA